jgi:IclR family transcriptional regulator, acetate operon repressor
MNFHFTLYRRLFMDFAKNGGRKARGRPRGWADSSAQNTIKSLDRAMEIFEHLSEDSGQALSSLAANLGQAPATVYRVLVTLESRGLVEFDPVEQLWHIGPRAFVIGARFLRRTSLIDRARPIMRRLMETTGETANLGIVQEMSVLFVSQVETHASIRAFFPPGTLSPLHASGIGKALLAEMSSERLDRIIRTGGLPRYTEKTLIEANDLIADLSATRERGHAIDNEEKNLGMRCIAAPVFDAHEEAAAGISVSGPTSRMGAERTDVLATAVMEAATALTAAIGGVSPTRPPS